ncbi:MAG: alpha-mannosidase [Armatimonadota bacterium]
MNRHIWALCVLVFGMLLVTPSQAADEGYIYDWLACGAFRGDDIHNSLDPLFATDAFPSSGGYTAGKSWQPIHAETMPVDFAKVQLNWDASEHCTAYTSVYVFSPDKQNATLSVGCDDKYASWLNGVEVGRSDAWQSYGVNWYKQSVTLRAGWNLLLMRVTNGTSFWQYSARFLGANGQPITNLKYQTDNPDPNGLFQRRTRLSSELKIISASMDGNGRIDGQKLLVNVRMSVANIGAAASAAYRVQAKDAVQSVLGAVELPVLSAGRAETVVLGIPYEKLVRASLLSRQEITVECGQSSVTVPVAQTEIMAMLFRPFRYEWTATLNNGQILAANTLSQAQLKQVKSYHIKDMLPEFVRRYQISAGIDIGWECVGRMLVNGKEVKDHFSGDSGDIALPMTHAADNRIDLFVPVNAGGAPRYDNGWLRVRIPTVENYLKSYQFAQILLKKPSGTSTPELKGILTALLTGDPAKIEAAVKSASLPIDKLAPLAKSYTAHMLGHGHIDLAWLWQTSEMIQVTKDTFRSALSMMDKYPEFKYSQSSAATYWWMEQYAPELLAQIKQRVKQGRWDPVGGMWSECDSNMPSGEALVRQFLYGQRYMKQQLGKSATAGWAPDTFGHAWSLPQILRKSGMESYTFMRCRPSDEPFWWVGLDGSRIFCSPTENYNSTVGDWIGERLVKNETTTKGGKDIAVVYGVGDHGGGPTMRDIEAAIELDKTKVFPNVKFDTAYQANKALKAQKAEYKSINTELNFIFQGCYTSQADVKKANRQLENLLPQSEAFSVVAQRYGGSYPSKDIFTAWRHTLFNQFHDILDGSGIHPIYDDAAKEYQQSIRLGQSALSLSLDTITRNIKVSGDSVVVYNPMAWPRTDVVELPNPSNADISVGEPGDCQKEEGKLVFIARDVPAMGYKLFPIRQTAPASTPVKSAVSATLDPKTGCMSSVTDAAGRELLTSGKMANDMWLHRETGDGWNIYPTGVIDKITANTDINVLVEGPVRSIRRVTLKQDKSEYVQDIVQYASLPRLDIRYNVRWQDRKTMLKADFPFDIKGATARFEIPFGSIVRAADGNEVVTQKWVDLSNKQHGVALLNDSKYGVSVSGSTIHMTLLRQPISPDPNGDVGDHEFALSLYPHDGDWSKGDVVRKGYEFNNPLIAVRTAAHAGSLPEAHSYLEGSANVVVTAMKKAEDSNDLVVRFYEHAGKASTAVITLDRAVASAVEMDNMEWKALGKLAIKGNQIIAPMKPWEYKTVRIRLR